MREMTTKLSSNNYLELSIFLHAVSNDSGHEVHYFRVGNFAKHICHTCLLEGMKALPTDSPAISCENENK